MVTVKVSLPNPDNWPLCTFLFARWKHRPPPLEIQADSSQLNYYLRVMRGPHWKLTVPLCVDSATDEDLSILETALAYMETSFCSRWFYPMKAWTPTRVLLIAVHACASRDPRLRPGDVQEFRDLIPCVTPHVRLPEPFDMSATVEGLARTVKQSFPMEIFHYREVYYREHWMAISRIFGLGLWKDMGTQSDDFQASHEASEDQKACVEDRLDAYRAGGELAPGYDNEIHCAEDPRESVTIHLTARTSPLLLSVGELHQLS